MIADRTFSEIKDSGKRHRKDRGAVRKEGVVFMFSLVLFCLVFLFAFSIPELKQHNKWRGGNSEIDMIEVVALKTNVSTYIIDNYNNNNNDNKDDNDKNVAEHTLGNTAASYG